MERERDRETKFADIMLGQLDVMVQVVYGRYVREKFPDAVL
jgi:hypothetical protein